MLKLLTYMTLHSHNFLIVDIVYSLDNYLIVTSTFGT